MVMTKRGPKTIEEDEKVSDKHITGYFKK